MKRFLGLVLSLLLFVTVMPVAAEGAVTVTLAIGETRETHTVSGDFTLPTPKTGEKVFVGWLWEKDGTPALYPAGAVSTPTENATLTAVAVGMKTVRPELRALSRADMGIRFLTEIDAADFAELEKLCPVGFGTIIAPLHYTIGGKGVFFPLTPQGLAEGHKTQYLEVKAGAFYRQNEAVNTVAGSINAIKGKNSTTNFLGVGYLSFTYADGSEGRAYAPTDRGNFASFYRLLCDFEASAPAGASEATQTLVRTTLARFAEVEWDTSSQPFGILRGNDLFAMTREKKTSDDVIFRLTVKPNVDFRFTRDFYALIANGAALRPDYYTVSADGKSISFEYSFYTINY